MWPKSVQRHLKQWETLLTLYHKSNEWNQTPLVVIVFFAVIHPLGNISQFHLRMFFMNSWVYLFNISYDSVGRTNKALLLVTEGWWSPWGKALMGLFELWTDLFVFFFFHGTLFLLERMTGRKTSYSDLCIWQTLSQKWKKVNLSLQGKQLTVFFYEKIWAFKWKLEFWKACIHHCEFNIFSIFKDFSDGIGGGINKCDFFWILFNICSICITQ